MNIGQVHSYGECTEPVGAWAGFSAIVVLAAFSYILTGSWTGVATKYKNLGFDALLESVFLLSFSTTALILLVSLAVFVASIGFDYFDRRHCWTGRRTKTTTPPLTGRTEPKRPSSLPLLAGFLGMILLPCCMGGTVFAWSTGIISLYDLSEDNLFHPENPRRMAMTAEKRTHQIRAMKGHECAMAQLDKEQVQTFWGGPVTPGDHISLITYERDKYFSLDVHYSGDLSGAGRSGTYEVKMSVNRSDGAVKSVNIVVIDESDQRLDLYGLC